jgi:membrane protein DedA with SNARE-associated domain
VDSLAQFLTSAVAHPAQQAFAIVLGTFILEDAATAATALVAEDGWVRPQLGLASLYAGIILGDFGLYGLGRLARRFEWVRSRLNIPQLLALADWLDRHLVRAVFASRFMPGMRLPTYTACGLLGMSFGRFAGSVVVATVIWTTLLFAASWSFGVYVLERLGSLRWLGGLALVLLLTLIFRHWAHRERGWGHP